MSSRQSKRSRRALKFSRKLLIGGAVLLGSAFFFSALANYIDRTDLTEVAGELSQIEQKQYWEDSVVYVRVQGARGKFKVEHDMPGFNQFCAAINKGTTVRLWVETAALEIGHPAPIYEAEVANDIVIRFDETQPIHNRETAYVMLLGPVFWFLGFWIWHCATRPLPTTEDAAAYREWLEQIAKKHWFLFLIVRIVDTARRWGEKIPKVGGVFTAFLFFWILPLYIAFIYVTAQSYRRLVAIFCYSYAGLLVGLAIAAATMPGFPGAEEYPALGPTGSRIFNAYILLNLAYGGAIWLWGTLTYEFEPGVASAEEHQQEIVEPRRRPAA